MSPRLKALLKRFRRDERGSATIEAVLWLPMFVIFFVMIADVSLVFFRQTEVLRVVQDGNRALSVGRFGGAAEVEQFVKDTIAPMTTRAQVTTTVNSGVINTKALVPVEDLVAVGMFNFLNGYNIAVQSNHYVEW
jgi:Flp pilus assembly protein TadG